MSGKTSNLDIREGCDIETGTISGEMTIDRIQDDNRSFDMSRIKKMLYNRIGPMILDYDLTRNEAVSYLLYEDGYTNSEVVSIMSQLFKKSFWRQNINDYRRKAVSKIDAVKDLQ